MFFFVRHHPKHKWEMVASTPSVTFVFFCFFVRPLVGGCFVCSVKPACVPLQAKWWPQLSSLLRVRDAAVDHHRQRSSTPGSTRQAFPSLRSTWNVLLCSLYTYHCILCCVFVVWWVGVRCYGVTQYKLAVTIVLNLLFIRVLVGWKQ